MKEFLSDIPKPIRFSSAGLVQLLLRLGFLNRDEVGELLAQNSNQKIISTLCRVSNTAEERVLQRISNDLGIARVELGSGDVNNILRDKVLMARLSPELALGHRVFPVSCDGEVLTIAMCDPLDVEAIAELEFASQCRIASLLASESTICRAIERWRTRNSGREAEKNDSKSIDVVMAQDIERGPGEESGASPPVVQLVNKILADAVRAGASDIHVEPNASIVDVRFRIDGVMVVHTEIPKQIQLNVATRLKLLAGMDIAERRRPQDGRFRMKLSEKENRDVRASSVPTPFGENIVLRILRGDNEKPTLPSLGMADVLRKSFEEALHGRDQIVLVTGPTGSGKTTTLYAAIDFLNTGRDTIVTIEDPIEVRFEGITQIQVDQKIGVTFASGLRSILRQDPDIILVGEIRDLETAEIAFQSAQTGHLVLSTLHTNDAVSSIVRLFDLGLEPYVVAESLRGVLSQRLVRRLCPSCAGVLPADEVEHLKRTLGIKDGSRLRRARGCSKCGQSGYRGRVGVYSFLQIDGGLRGLIRSGKSMEEIREAAKRSGMRDLTESAAELIEAGVTTVEEARRVLGTDLCPQEEQLPNRVKPSESLASLARKAEKSSIRVLVVDDDSGVRAVLSRALQKANYQVVQANNGHEALAIASTLKPDIILCDLIMPGMDGRALLRSIRENTATSAIPVIMLSGSDSEENEISLIEEGADDFISKASSPEVVLTRLKRVLALAVRSV